MFAFSFRCVVLLRHNKNTTAAPPTDTKEMSDNRKNDFMSLHKQFLEIDRSFIVFVTQYNSDSIKYEIKQTYFPTSSRCHCAWWLRSLLGWKHLHYKSLICVDLHGKSLIPFCRATSSTFHLLHSGERGECNVRFQFHQNVTRNAAEL